MDTKTIDTIMDVLLVGLQILFYIAAGVSGFAAVRDVGVGWPGYGPIIHASSFLLLGFATSFFYIYVKALAARGD